MRYRMQAAVNCFVIHASRMDGGARVDGVDEVDGSGRSREGDGRRPRGRRVPREEDLREIVALVAQTRGAAVD